MRFVVETMATVAPSPRSRAAVAYPMPSELPAPVTNATLPSRRSASIVISLPSPGAPCRPTPPAADPAGDRRRRQSAAPSAPGGQAADDEDSYPDVASGGHAHAAVKSTRHRAGQPGDTDERPLSAKPVRAT